MPQFADQCLALCQLYALDNSVGFDRDVQQHQESILWKPAFMPCANTKQTSDIEFPWYEVQNKRQGTYAVTPDS